MRKIIFIVFAVLLIGCKPSIYLQKDAIQLSKPKILFDNAFFEESTTVNISITAKKAKLYYSTFGGEMQQFKNPILIKESTKIVAQALGGGYLPSDSSNIELIKLPKSEIIAIKSDRVLNEKYSTGGLSILIDRKKGESDFNRGWLGYGGDTIIYDLEFDIIEVDKVIISTLRNQGAWIFSPDQINVYSNGNLIGDMKFNNRIEEAKNSNVFSKIDVIKTKTRKLTIEIIAPEHIPSWHPGKGTKPWIFIDEILIY